MFCYYQQASISMFRLLVDINTKPLLYLRFNGFKVYGIKSKNILFNKAISNIFAIKRKSDHILHVYVNNNFVFD